MSWVYSCPKLKISASHRLLSSTVCTTFGVHLNAWEEYWISKKEAKSIKRSSTNVYSWLKIVFETDVYVNMSTKKSSFILI